MYIGRYCPGCGGGDGNQGCKIARCGMERGNMDYCFRCSEYPCQKYEHIDENDSFITHRNQKADLEKAKNIGIDAYNNEQKEKMQILDYLLMNFNDGRKKTLFCQTVNLQEYRLNPDRGCCKNLVRDSATALDVSGKED